ncbi:hypothetical protein GCM10009836_67140 [Pseudonocardia ailaonensis]|uniref:Uncharacterized protein n=1 Tax=Pseudonocardia ailaonensis TaxID=367279 RepID=A0ABN2NN71_9PSEU
MEITPVTTGLVVVGLLAFFRLVGTLSGRTNAGIGRPRRREWQ